MPSNEKNRRSIAKALTFRALIVCADFPVIYLVTRRVDTTIWLTVVRNVLATFLYFIHERAWNKVGWGKTPDAVRP